LSVRDARVGSEREQRQKTQDDGEEPL
jgi:hypothetical protein